MGDRTWVKITVHKHYASMIEKDLPHLYQEKDGDDLIEFFSEEENHAEWEELESYLQTHNIDYDKEWGDGGEYKAGTGYFRKGKIIEHSNEEWNIASILRDCLEAKDIEKYIKRQLKDYHKVPDSLIVPNSIDYFTKKK